MFKNLSKTTYLPQAITVAELVLRDEDFLRDISSIQSFYYSTDTGAEVVKKISTGAVAYVSTYRTRNPWSSVTAKTVGHSISFNSWNNPRPLKFMVNTLVHEYLHVLGYSHKGNNPKGNEKTVPYLVGDIAERYVSKYIGVL